MDLLVDLAYGKDCARWVPRRTIGADMAPSETKKLLSEVMKKIIEHYHKCIAMMGDFLP